eukprot:CAMPEP_0118648100 /NCGR_PEP_ID=MMETSP0785-20121206/8969_1 /TAXON_ID=91992 /ORGANISM="Bolidomonas pacifica, Strain CCMP 1866" /LENGTH=92 /DNA_ID=CAMNT_0006540257 /DNA_START=465 /DNA_END=743 /DNA_ORIENTATION=-
MAKDITIVTRMLVMGIIIIGTLPSTKARVIRARGRMVVSILERSDSTPSRVSYWNNSIPVMPAWKFCSKLDFVVDPCPHGISPCTKDRMLRT